jgi:hypothetical protein
VHTTSLEGYPLEQVAIEPNFLITEDGAPIGRLHAKIFPAFARDGNSRLYVFELTARGAPRGGSVGEAIAFLDRGREAIDRMFVAMTTRGMHEEWGINE